jgi:hypothetical protein
MMKMKLLNIVLDEPFEKNSTNLEKQRLAQRLQAAELEMHTSSDTIGWRKNPRIIA